MRYLLSLEDVDPPERIRFTALVHILTSYDYLQTHRSRSITEWPWSSNLSMHTYNRQSLLNESSSATKRAWNGARGMRTPRGDFDALQH